MSLESILLFLCLIKYIYIYSINHNIGDNFDDGERGERHERGERGRGRGRGRGGRGFRPTGDGGGETNEEAGDDKKTPVTYVPPEPTENEDEIFSSTISSGINFDKFDCIAVKVSTFNAYTYLILFSDPMILK